MCLLRAAAASVEEILLEVCATRWLKLTSAYYRGSPWIWATWLAWCSLISSRTIGHWLWEPSHLRSGIFSIRLIFREISSLISSTGGTSNSMICMLRETPRIFNRSRIASTLSIFMPTSTMKIWSWMTLTLPSSTQIISQTPSGRPLRSHCRWVQTHGSIVSWKKD